MVRASDLDVCQCMWRSSRHFLLAEGLAVDPELAGGLCIPFGLGTPQDPLKRVRKWCWREGLQLGSL